MISLLSLSAVAQEQKVVVVRQDDSRSESTYKRKVRAADRNVENYNAFKFDPLRMAIGEINFSWETRVQERTTLEFELGPTVSNLRNSRFEIDYLISPGELQFEVNSAMGALASAAVRFYPLEDYQAMNKLYVSPRIKYRRYNETYTAEATPLSAMRGGSNEFIFSFNIGFQQWLSNNFAFDYYFGVGIGSYSGVSYSPASVYDGNVNDWTYSWDRNDTQYSRFIATIGMKVTIGN